MRAVVSVIILCITLPIWYYLIYQILLRVNASELMWFLFYVYVPANMLAQVLGKLIHDSERAKK